MYGSSPLILPRYFWPQVSYPKLSHIMKHIKDSVNHPRVCQILREVLCVRKWGSGPSILTTISLRKLLGSSIAGRGVGMNGINIHFLCYILTANQHFHLTDLLDVIFNFEVIYLQKKYIR